MLQSKSAANKLSLITRTYKSSSCGIARLCQQQRSFSSTINENSTSSSSTPITYLTHISDVHVWPNNFTPSLSQLLPNFKDAKRLQGYLNIKLTRGGKYSNNVLAAALQDMVSQEFLKNSATSQQHLIISGDITNLALREEFEAARQIFDQHYFQQRLANGATMPIWQLATAVPGNHDAYTPESVSSDWFGQYFGDTLTSTTANTNHNIYDKHRMYKRFPSVKRLPNSRVIIVALNSSVPRIPFVSGGKLSEAMLEQASKQLQEIYKTEENYHDWFRVCVLHHPPMQRHKYGYQEVLRGFTVHDRELLTQFCKTEKINLILNGHSHKQKVAQLYDTTSSKSEGTLSVDPGSGTYIGEKVNKTARYNCYKIVGSSLQSMYSRVWQAASQTFETKELKW